MSVSGILHVLIFRIFASIGNNFYFAQIEASESVASRDPSTRSYGRSCEVFVS